MSDRTSGIAHLPGEVAQVWSLVGGTNAVARQKIGLDDVKAIVRALSENPDAGWIVIYTGVHGTPSGQIQIDAPEFSEEDNEAFKASAGAETTLDVIDIVQELDFDLFRQVIPDDMEEVLNDKKVYTVLAWCYSEDFLRYHKYQST